MMTRRSLFAIVAAAFAGKRVAAGPLNLGSAGNVGLGTPWPNQWVDVKWGFVPAGMRFVQRVSGEIQMDLWGAALASYAERARYLTRDRLQAEHDYNVEAHLYKFASVTAAELERRKGGRRFEIFGWSVDRQIVLVRDLETGAGRELAFAELYEAYVGHWGGG